MFCDVWNLFSTNTSDQKCHSDTHDRDKSEYTHHVIFQIIISVDMSVLCLMFVDVSMLHRLDWLIWVYLLTFVWLFRRAYKKKLWHLHKLLSTYFHNPPRWLTRTAYSYMKIFWLYFIFCYRNSVYIRTYMINIYDISA